MNLSKLFGGILLVTGTSIGGGMLALPVALAQTGFLGALILLFACWFVMTLGALLILEVNLRLPENSNIISMAKQTLGKPGEFIAWISYLLLLYSLLAAYTSGGADVLNSLVFWTKNQLALSLHSIIFILILGSIVFLGIQLTDYINRILLTVKLVAFLLLVVLISPHVELNRLDVFNSLYLIPAVTVTITSFGFATLVPSLRCYFDSDAKRLRQAIIIGSLIPLVCYTLWVAVILSDLPMQGQYGLIHMLTSSQPTSALVQSIQMSITNGSVNTTAHLFTSICVATSFLGVALSLSDFLADGTGLKKQGLQKIVLFLLTFTPPLIVALVFPRAFLLCLSYAGTLCVVLLMVLPAFMAWRGRYVLKLESVYQMSGGKFALTLVILAGFFVIAQEIALSMGLLKHVGL